MAKARTHAERAEAIATKLYDRMEQGDGLPAERDLADLIAREMFPEELVDAAQGAQSVAGHYFPSWERELLCELRAALALYPTEEATP